MSFLMSSSESESEDEPITIVRKSKSGVATEILPNEISCGKPSVKKGLVQLDVTPLQLTAGTSKVTENSGVKKFVSSTPLENHGSQGKKRMIEELERRLNVEVNSHRKKLKAIRSMEKANNLEFLKVMSIEMNGETLLPMNDSEEMVWFQKDGEWINLMTVYAGPQPSKFGRHLATKMFGKDEDCRLMVEMIGCERQSVLTRTPIPKEEEKLFRRVVELKYPLEASYAYSEARLAANAMGVGYRRKYPGKLRQLLNEQHKKMIADKLQTTTVFQDDLE